MPLGQGSLWPFLAAFAAGTLVLLHAGPASASQSGVLRAAGRPLTLPAAYAHLRTALSRLGENYRASLRLSPSPTSDGSAWTITHWVNAAHDVVRQREDGGSNPSTSIVDSWANRRVTLPTGPATFATCSGIAPSVYADLVLAGTRVALISQPLAQQGNPYNTVAALPTLIEALQRRVQGGSAH